MMGQLLSARLQKPHVFECLQSNILLMGISTDILDQDIKFAHTNGFQIASHTWSHKDATSLSYTDFVDEVLRNDNYLNGVIGKTPRYFRFPFLSFDDSKLKARRNGKDLC